MGKAKKACIDSRAAGDSGGLFRGRRLDGEASSAGDLFFDNSVVVEVAQATTRKWQLAREGQGQSRGVSCESLNEPREKDRYLLTLMVKSQTGPVAGSDAAGEWDKANGAEGSREATRGDGSDGPVEGRINAAKLLRACGGCLGARRRRRAWKTAKSPVELSNER